MADKVVQLTDKDNNNIFPVTQKNITMTDVDPGEGASLAADNYIAVYGGSSSLLDFFYPVGTYYETSDTTFNPNTAWGGTWVEDTTGRVTVAQDSGTFNLVGATGGSETHTHDYGIWTSGWYGMLAGVGGGDHIQLWDGSSWTAGTIESGGSQNVSANPPVGGSNAAASTKRKTTTSSTSSLPPYIVVKRWHRVA